MRRVRDTGAVDRCQGPLVRGINDSAEAWAGLWNETTALGAVPYYQFVERDTGPQGYFGVPARHGHQIFRDTYAQVSGLARTVRGPVMSAMPGELSWTGSRRWPVRRSSCSHLIQARDPELVGRPFFAAYDENATWSRPKARFRREPVPARPRPGVTPASARGPYRRGRRPGPTGRSCSPLHR